MPGYSVKNFEASETGPVIVRNDQQMVKALSDEARHQFVQNLRHNETIIVKSGLFNDYIKVFDAITKPRIAGFVKHARAIKEKFVSQDSEGVFMTTLSFKGQMTTDEALKFCSLFKEGTPQHSWAMRKGYDLAGIYTEHTYKGIQFFTLGLAMIPL